MLYPDHPHAEQWLKHAVGSLREAMRIYFTDTHNVAEGAGAAPLAALLKEKDKIAGKKVAAVLSGGNVDKAVYLEVLAGG